MTTEVSDLPPQEVEAAPPAAEAAVRESSPVRAEVAAEERKAEERKEEAGPADDVVALPTTSNTKVASTTTSGVTTGATASAAAATPEHTNNEEQVESQPVESQPVESQPVESQPAESQPVEPFLVGEDKPKTESSSTDREETATDATAESTEPIVSSSKKSRPPYKFDSEKITLRFLFANRDGLTVTVECKPSDTVGEVKGALISVWPEDMPSCESGENLRLICMGKGFLSPDTRTLEDCEVPVFKTHPTPVNVSVKPVKTAGCVDVKKKGSAGSALNGGGHPPTTETTQGCGCVIS